MVNMFSGSRFGHLKDLLFFVSLMSLLTDYFNRDLIALSWE